MVLQEEAALENVSTWPRGERRGRWRVGGRGVSYLVMEEQSR